MNDPEDKSQRQSLRVSHRSEMGGEAEEEQLVWRRRVKGKCSQRGLEKKVFQEEGRGQECQMPTRGEAGELMIWTGARSHKDGDKGLTGAVGNAKGEGERGTVDNGRAGKEGCYKQVGEG